MLNLRRFTLAALGATVLPWLQAQVPVRDAAEVQKALDKLQVVGSVLYLAAHPDDENTAVLATLSKGWNLRTTMARPATWSRSFAATTESGEISVR